MASASAGKATHSTGAGGSGENYTDPLTPHEEQLWRGYGSFAQQHSAISMSQGAIDSLVGQYPGASSAELNQWLSKNLGPQWGLEYNKGVKESVVTIRVDELLAKNPELVHALAQQPEFRDAVVDVVIHTYRQPLQGYVQ